MADIDNTQDAKITGITPESILLKAVERAAKKANPMLVKILEVHLRNEEGKGFELAFENPSRFVESVKNLFGEYSGRFFELLIIQELMQALNLEDKPYSLSEAVEILKKVKADVEA